MIELKQRAMGLFNKKKIWNTAITIAKQIITKQHERGKFCSESGMTAEEYLTVYKEMEDILSKPEVSLMEFLAFTIFADKKYEKAALTATKYAQDYFYDYTIVYEALFRNIPSSSEWVEEDGCMCTARYGKKTKPISCCKLCKGSGKRAKIECDCNQNIYCDKCWGKGCWFL